MHTTTRNATMSDLRTLLMDQQARKVDFVTPASTLRAEEALLRVRGAQPVLGDDGVDLMDGLYRPTLICDDQIADKLGIPVAYLRKMRETRPDLYDANVNGWLHGRREKVRLNAGREVLREGIPGDSRSFLLRTFRPEVIYDPTGPIPIPAPIGVARALLSDRYQIIDHLDALTAALDGVRQAGVEVVIEGADLTDRRMMVRVSAPSVTALAPELLAGYRSPFTGESGTDNPTVFAGFVISNSETASGAFTIVPRLTVQVCRNGMTVTKDAMRAVHLGGRMEEGLIRWSEDTQAKTLALITAKARDAVDTFLDVDYMRQVITRWSAKAGQSMLQIDQVQEATKRLGFSNEHIDGILSQFVQGGQMTVGGITNAITAYAQTVDDGDDAYELEAKATLLLT